MQDVTLSPQAKGNTGSQRFVGFYDDSFADFVSGNRLPKKMHLATDNHQCRCA